MSRKAIIVFLIVYLIVALAISILWELATPGVADVRRAAIIGSTLGRTAGFFALPAVLPLIYWAIRRSHADPSGVLTAWGILGAILVVLSGIGSVSDGSLRPDKIPANISEFFTNDYDTFIRVVTSNCTDSAKKNQSKSGLTEPQIRSYCQCVAETLLNRLTVAELKMGLYARSGDTTSIEEKSSKASLECQHSTLGR
jgi:hypothetical protein